ncbi:hypothetical protein OOK31_14005 [Streptomyces sp. NBC_00249]|uniref:hypothetical protein n=1 Tax=Streptomyces sp. NBC_00249 TaxID=2975690 RepID=UPI0022518AA4|nr:hypothetical protein [Streptomyces sp. NBC_00249]MCX5195005.1 hypothetical protein [Streptomyces sp. NBC_00249]
MRRALGAVLAAVTGVALLTGCGLRDLRDDKAVDPAAPSALPSFETKAPVPPGKPLDAQAKVQPVPAPDPSDPNAVARAWLATAYGYDTAYDNGPQDANLRALPYLTEEQAKAERDYRPGAGSGSEWATWAEHKAWMTLAITEDDDDQGPGGTAGASFRTFYVDGKAHGRDGWTGPGPRLTAVVKLTLAGPAGWKVAGITVTPAATPPSAVPSSSSSPAASSPSPSPSTTAR